jgi:hypothetical protein
MIESFRKICTIVLINSLLNNCVGKLQISTRFVNSLIYISDFAARYTSISFLL